VARNGGPPEWQTPGMADPNRKRSGKMNAGVSFEKVDCPRGSVSRNTELLEDKELATDFMHDMQ